MRRIGLVGLGIVLLFVLNGFAVPIKPNLEKILDQQQRGPQRYEPARAGWDGPEAASPQEASPNPVYETYGPSSTARAVRASLKAAVTPDPGAIIAIGLLILLWRIARQQRLQREPGNLVTMPAPAAASPESRAA